MKLDLIVVIPVYNEEEIIRFVIEDWVKCLDELKINYRIKLYNDGSSDNTERVIKEVLPSCPNIDLINKENSGHGPTILRAYKDNLELADWIFQVDSDNEMSPSYFKFLWEAREKYDFLIGHRYNREFSFARLILTTLSRITIFSLFGRNIVDVNSPYRLFRARFFDKAINLIPNTTFAPNIILSGVASREGARTKSILVPYNFRTTGTVSLKQLKLLKIGLKCFKQTLQYRLGV